MGRTFFEQDKQPTKCENLSFQKFPTITYRKSTSFSFSHREDQPIPHSVSWCLQRWFSPAVLPPGDQRHTAASPSSHPPGGCSELLRHAVSPDSVEHCHHMDNCRCVRMPYNNIPSFHISSSGKLCKFGKYFIDTQIAGFQIQFSDLNQVPN